MKSAPKDVQIPLTLIVAAFLLFALAGYRVAGPSGPAAAMAAVGVAAVIGTALMLAAAFVTASMIGVSFGELGPAALKLAAIYLFPAAVGTLLPYGGFFALVIWLALLLWLFDLEVYQAVVFAIILFVVNWLTAILIRNMFA